MVPPTNAGRPPESRAPSRSTTRGRGKTAPLGIKIFCVLGALVALYSLFLSLRIMAAGGPFASLGFVLLILGVGYAVVLWGLWTVKPWAWTWGLILFGLDALHSLVTLELLGMLVSVALFTYLYGKKHVYR